MARLGHPFAKGNQRTKLCPKYPYFGGHNQKSERKAAAQEAAAMGYDKPPFYLSGLSHRRLKKVQALCKNGFPHSSDLNALGRQQRRVILDLQTDLAREYDEQLYRYAI